MAYHKEDKRPIGLWIISVFVLLSGTAAFLMTATAPNFIPFAKILSYASVLVQIGSGILLIMGRDLGRRLYMIGMPVIIIVQAIFLGTVVGFTDDDYLFRALAPFAIYGIVVLVLTRSSIRLWLAEWTNETKSN